jgi:hypothetical protein
LASHRDGTSSAIAHLNVSWRVLLWMLSITEQSAICAETSSDALARHGTSEIVNVDPALQFNGTVFTGVLSTTISG